MLRTRVITAAVAIPALFVLVRYLWSPLFAGFIVAVAAVGLYEYFGMALPEHAADRLVGMLAGVGVTAGVVVSRPAVWGAAMALGVIGGFLLALLRAPDLDGGVHRLGLTLLGILYVGFFIAHAVPLREGTEGWQWVLFTVFVAMGSDSGGYFAGRGFGRHPLAPQVSPKKTVEGALGAIAGAMFIAGICRSVFFRTLGIGEALVLAATMSVLAQLGDLCESALKRAFGAKDSGWIIPGHGGILDRLDSIVFPVVFAYYYTAFARL
jgi:phosphatidate cytidylyltransferase